MNIKLPCEIVDDLLPSYIDGLTNNTTSEAVKSHIDGCKKCYEKYQNMKGEDAILTEDTDQKTEVNFLKKTKKRHIGITIGAIVLVLILSFAYYVYASFNGGVGSSIKKAKLTKEVKAYVADVYKDRTDLVVDKAEYDFKMGKFYCHVASTESPDTQFTVYSINDHLVDDYEDAVTGLTNTEIRLRKELYDTVENLMLEDLPFDSRLFFADFSEIKEIDRSKMSLDMKLDLDNPVAPININMWVATEQDTPDWEEWKSVLRKLRDYTESKGIHAGYYSVWLEYPYTEQKGEKIPTDYSSEISIDSVPADIIDDDEALDKYINEKLSQVDEK